jgi:hypothetical protein
MVVLIGFAALTIDVGYMYSVRLDLQNAADAAALTAAGAYASDERYVAQTAGSGLDVDVVKSLAYSRAKSLFALNPSMGTSATQIDFDDLVLGHVDIHSTDPMQTSIDPSELNAAYARARRDDDCANGPVELFFAQVFGYQRTNVNASAVAAFDDRVSGVRGVVLIPFTIRRKAFDDYLEKGGDDYQFDSEAESVAGGGDGIREIHLYPYNSTPGNFGLLNIGGESSSGDEISTQITNGITADDLEMSFGTSELQFLNPEGDIAETVISGNTGLHSSFESDIEPRVGDVVGIFVHESAMAVGSNTKYKVSGVRFVRIMAIDLGGKPKYFKVQPAIYAGDGVVLDPDAPSTGGLIGQIVLAR